jgi:hypothetical protein
MRQIEPDPRNLLTLIDVNVRRSVIVWVEDHKIAVLIA